MSVQDKEHIEFPRAIICEGPDDVSFFAQLIEQRSLPRFHLMHTGKTRQDRGGNSKFAEKLGTLLLDRRFRNVIKDIVFVSDSDSNHDASFNKICKQLSDSGYAAPTQPMKRGAGTPAISILMVPPKEAGTLECLCISAAMSADMTMAATVSNFVDVVTRDKWATCARGKLWLRSSLAARWKSDPFIHLGQVFHDKRTRALIPLSHKSFNGIAKFLASFGS